LAHYCVDAFGVEETTISLNLKTALTTAGSYNEHTLLADESKTMKTLSNFIAKTSTTHHFETPPIPSSSGTGASHASRSNQQFVSPKTHCFPLPYDAQHYRYSKTLQQPVATMCAEMMRT
jgi:hypothetical protein